jgi:hypothetical protein
MNHGDVAGGTVTAVRAEETRTEADAGSVSEVVIRSWLPVAMVVATIGLLARLAARPLDNPDTYFHLRIGHEFLHGGWMPWAPGHLTSFESKTWAPTQWLSQVVMAAVEDHAGLAGIAWLSGLLFVGWGLAVYASVRQRAGLLASAVLVPLVMLGGETGLSMRPQVASYAATALTMIVWQRARASARPPWAAIAITWVWAMVHGMWPVGIVIGLAACCGIAMDRKLPLRQAARWLAVPVLAAVAAAFTPIGPRLYPAVLLVSSRSDVFTEWSPPDFTTFHCLIVLGLFAAVLAIRLRRGPLPWFDVFMVLVALGWSVYTSRTIPVAATMLAPLVGSALQDLIGPREGRGKVERYGVAGGAAVALAALALAVPHTAKPLEQPRWVAATFENAPAGTKVIDEMTFGSYLLWRYPNVDPTVHGYADVYSDAQLKRIIDTGRLEKGWQDNLRATGAELALLSPDSRLAYALTTSEEWTVTHRSKNVELLSAPADWLTAH